MTTFSLNVSIDQILQHANGRLKVLLFPLASQVHVHDDMETDISNKFVSIFRSYMHVKLNPKFEAIFNSIWISRMECL